MTAGALNDSRKSTAWGDPSPEKAGGRPSCLGMSKRGLPVKNIQRYIRNRERERRDAFIAELNLDEPGAKQAMEELVDEVAKQVFPGAAAQFRDQQLYGTACDPWKRSCIVLGTNPNEEPNHEEDRAPSGETPDC